MADFRVVRQELVFADAARMHDMATEEQQEQRLVVFYKRLVAQQAGLLPWNNRAKYLRS